MTVKLSQYDQAYNHLTDLLNAKEAELDKVLDERDAAYRALDALYPGIGHGARRRYRVKLVRR